MTNEQKFDKGIDHLQHQREILLGKIEPLNQNQLDFRPSRQSWSVGQVAYHVGMAESVWLGYLKKLLKSAGQERKATLEVSLDELPFSSRIIPDFVLRSWLFLTPASFFIKLIPRPVQSMLFAVPIFKMDAGPRMQPKHGESRAHVLRYLAETRREALDLLQPLKDWDLTRLRIVHPLVGEQDVYGVLELLSSHEQRHSQQIEAIKSRSSFPK